MDRTVSDRIHRINKRSLVMTMGTLFIFKAGTMSYMKQSVIPVPIRAFTESEPKQSLPKPESGEFLYLEARKTVG